MTPLSLKTLRLGSGLTQGGLAVLLGVNVRTVQRWEDGTRGISEPMDKLIRITTERTEK